MSRLDKPTPGEGQATSGGPALPRGRHEPPFEFYWRCQVRRVIDGDSLELLVHISPHVYEVAFARVVGVNTPEVVGVNKAAGLAAKAFTQSWVDKGVATWVADMYPFVITCGQADSFGRYLVNIWHRAGAAALVGTGVHGGPYGPSLAEELIRAGHGVPA